MFIKGFFMCRFGSLFCLSQARTNSKAKFATGSITSLISTIQKRPKLIKASNSTNTQIGKLYFRPKQPKSASDASSLQNEISKIKSELSDLRGAGASLQCNKYILNPSCTLSVHLLAVHLLPFLQNQ